MSRFERIRKSACASSGFSQGDRSLDLLLVLSVAFAPDASSMHEAQIPQSDRSLFVPALYLGSVKTLRLFRYPQLIEKGPIQQAGQAPLIICECTESRTRNGHLAQAGAASAPGRHCIPAHAAGYFSLAAWSPDVVASLDRSTVLPAIRSR
jgi:hypothetical protein